MGAESYQVCSQTQKSNSIFQGTGSGVWGGAGGVGHGSLFGNKMKAMGLLLHKIHLHLYTQNFHKTLEVHGPLRDP